MTKHWTAQTAAALDWEAFHRVFYPVFYPGPASDDDIQAMAGAGLLTINHGTRPDGGLCWGAITDRVRAVKEYRDSVVASLDPGDRACLQLAAFAAWVDFTGERERLGIIDAQGKQTRFGREVLRALGGLDEAGPT